MMNSSAGCDDIYDRIDCADLMEVDILHRHVVDLRLRGAKKLECVDGCLLYRFGQRCGLDQCPDHAQ